MAAEVVKLAPCELYFVASGGTLAPDGTPSLTQEDIQEGDRQFARLLCDTGFDCGQCPLMHQWVTSIVASGWGIGWWCDLCCRETNDFQLKRLPNNRILKGFYQSGRDPNLPPDDFNYDGDCPALPGCTRCGHQSSLLQLVLIPP